MPYLRFISLAFVGSIIWICGLALIGQAVGSDWSSWRSHLEYVDYVVVALVVGLLAWIVVRRIRNGPRAHA
jgi:membrane protein DedA with SNARE-associated domain